MTEDELMNVEGRAATNRYIASFNGDWDALFADLQRRTEARKSEGYRVATPGKGRNEERLDGSAGRK